MQKNSLQKSFLFFGWKTAGADLQFLVDKPIEDEESSDEELRFESKEGEKFPWYISIIEECQLIIESLKALVGFWPYLDWYCAFSQYFGPFEVPFSL